MSPDEIHAQGYAIRLYSIGCDTACYRYLGKDYAVCAKKADEVPKYPVNITDSDTPLMVIRFSDLERVLANG